MSSDYPLKGSSLLICLRSFVGTPFLVAENVFSTVERIADLFENIGRGPTFLAFGLLNAAGAVLGFLFLGMSNTDSNGKPTGPPAPGLIPQFFGLISPLPLLKRAVHVDIDGTVLKGADGKSAIPYTGGLVLGSFLPQGGNRVHSSSTAAPAPTSESVQPHSQDGTTRARDRGEPNTPAETERVENSDLGSVAEKSSPGYASISSGRDERDVQAAAHNTSKSSSHSR